jgi:hypothetical protein
MSSRLALSIYKRVPLSLQTPLLKFRHVRFCSSHTDDANMDVKESAHKHTISRYLQQSHARIFENNRKWVAEKKEQDPQFFDKLAAGQTPEYLYVC